MQVCISPQTVNQASTPALSFFTVHMPFLPPNQHHQSTEHTHTLTTVLLLFWNMSGTTWVSSYQKGKTRQVKTNLDVLEQEIVSGSGICWAICKVCSSSQTITPTSHHSVFLQAGCPSCRPTNSIKALKVQT